LFTSIDTGSKPAEYIRDGLSNERYYNHLKMIMDAVPNIEVSFMITFGPLSLFNFTELLDFIVTLRERYPNNKIGIGIAVLNYPSHFDLKILPERFRPWFDKITAHFENPMNKWPQYERDYWKTLLTHWETTKDDNGHLDDRIDFYRFFKEHDFRRKTSILLSVPEIEEFYLECEELSYARNY
jgi:hypothetical protein